jgi:hypothetical protein
MYLVAVNAYNKNSVGNNIIAYLYFDVNTLNINLTIYDEDLVILYDTTVGYFIDNKLSLNVMILLRKYGLDSNCWDIKPDIYDQDKGIYDSNIYIDILRNYKINKIYSNVQ